MNIETFINECKKIGINLTDFQLEQFNIYANFLIEYNNHTNLTAITDIEDIYLKHFYDSLTIVKLIDLNNYHNLIDIGTGAGFPGMVIAIVFPNINVTLLDSNNKKIKFLDELINKLNITNVKTIYARCEEYAKSHLEEYDLVVSRAVANLQVLSELSLPLVKVNGYFISLKGNATEEIEMAKDIIKTLNGSMEELLEFNLPLEEAKRTIIKIKKINNTPSGYPRNYKIIKNELKKNIK